MRRTLLRAIGIVGVIVGTVPPPAWSGTVWDGGGANTNIDTPANWDNDALPVFDGSVGVTFGTGGSAAVNNRTDNTALLGIVFNRAGSFALNDGGTSSVLILGAGGITADAKTATYTYTIAEAVRLASNQSWSTATSTTSLTLSGPVELNGYNLTLGGNGGTITLSDAVSGSGSLVKSGNSSAIFSKTNGYSGTTTIEGGALRANDGQGLTSRNLLLNGGVLEGSGAVTFNRTLGTDDNQVQFGSSGGGFSANGGRMTVNLGGSGATLAWDSDIKGTLKFGSTVANNETLFQNGLNLKSTANRTIDVTDNSSSSGDFATIAGVISNTSGAGGLVKTGSGKLVLTAANTYSGHTVLNGGILSVASADSLGSGNLSFGGGTLEYTGGNLDLNRTSTFTGNGTISVTGSATSLTLGAVNDNGGARTINKSGSGTLVLASPAASIVSGTQVNVTGGTLRLSDAAAIGTLAKVSVSTGTTLSLGTNQTIGALTNGGTVALNGNTLTVGSTNNLSSSFAGKITDGTAFGALLKSGTGVLTLVGPNTHSGGTVVSSGTLVAGAVGSLGTGAVTLENGGTLTLAAPQGSLASFGGSGTGWTLNGGATAAGDVLTVTTALGSQARSAFYNRRVSTDPFTISFTYNASQGGTNPADGLTMVFQNDDRETKAIGNSGGDMGYADLQGGVGIRPSAGLAINLYPSGSRGIGSSLLQGGNRVGYTTATGINVYETPVDVRLVYNGSALTATLTQGAATFTKTYENVNLADLVGKAAYLGFTGGTGGCVALQTISNFHYDTTVPVATAFDNNVLLNAGANANVTLLADAATHDYRLGNLAIGSGATLNLATETGSATNQAYSLAVGTTTLAGPATFNVANNGAGQGSLVLGSLQDGGSARTITKTGAGALTLAASAASLVHGTQVNVAAGTLNSNHATALGTLAQVNVASGATLAVGASQTLGSLTGRGTVALHGNTLTVGSTNNLPSSFLGSFADGSAPGVLRKAGAGTLTVAGSSTHSGQTIVSAGKLLVGSSDALGTSQITLGNGTTLALAAPVTSMAGFGNDGTAWTFNGGSSAAADVLTVTTNEGSLARSAYFNHRLSTAPFTIQFTYHADQGGANPADGLAMVFQNDPRGPAALGASGHNLGYSGTTPVSPSTGFAINLYANNTRGIGNNLLVNGSLAGGYMPPTDINLYDVPVDVQLAYNGSTLTATLTQGGTAFTQTYSGVDLNSLLGQGAYFGFSGGTGGSVARQRISNFRFTSSGLVSTAYDNDVTLSDGASANLAILAGLGSRDYSLGNLTMGTGATLRLSPETGSPVNEAYRLRLGTTTLAGPATFEVANNGTATGTLVLGEIHGAAGSLTKTGDGTLVLTGTSDYTGPTALVAGTLLVDGSVASKVTVSGGLLGGLGTIHGDVTVQSTGILSAGHSPGILTIDGDLLENGQLLVELGGPSDYDRVNVVGQGHQATLNGLVSVVLDEGYSLDAGGVFNVLTAPTITTGADFAIDFALAPLAPSQYWTYAILGTAGSGQTLQLSVGVPEPAALVLLGLGVATLALCARLRRRATVAARPRI
jgi:autotransporter-associated beta strand protein